ncbi:MAG: helix-turn-helix transcriptional regulator, partial [Ruminococcus sp.]
MVKNLKLLRTKKGLSQQQLADIIGTSQQSINKYEN